MVKAENRLDHGLSLTYNVAWLKFGEQCDGNQVIVSLAQMDIAWGRKISSILPGCR